MRRGGRERRLRRFPPRPRRLRPASRSGGSAVRERCPTPPSPAVCGRFPQERGPRRSRAGGGGSGSGEWQSQEAGAALRREPGAPPPPQVPQRQMPAAAQLQGEGSSRDSSVLAVESGDESLRARKRSESFTSYLHTWRGSWFIVGP